jgi:hypothetical protein
LRLRRLNRGSACVLDSTAGALGCCGGAGFDSPEGLVSLLMRNRISFLCVRRVVAEMVF